MHSDTIWNDLELQRNFLKTMSLKDAFMIWNYREHFETNASKARVRSDGIWNDLELQRNRWKQCLWSMHSDGIWNDFEM